jgi:DNA primase
VLVTILPESRRPLTPDPDQGRYGFRKAIEAIKYAVPIEQVAVEYGEFKLLGNGRLLGRCVAPDHEDRTPSMTVYTDSQKFRCYGCNLGGDVIDLEELVGQHLETWTAIEALATRYGVELPQRPERWHRHQDTKAEMREEMRRGLAKVYQRRLYRMFHDAGAHPEDDAALWEAIYPAAYLAATRRVIG